MGLFNRIKKIVLGSKDESSNIYDKGLSKTRAGFTSKLVKLSKKYKEIDNHYFDELEEILIEADIGVHTVMKFVDKLQVRVLEEKITNPKMLNEIIVDELFIIYVDNQIISNKINYNETGPTVMLFIGVNGVGKTTTIAKLATKFKANNKKVLLVAADTFRAGAVEQLIEWSVKTETDVVYDYKTEDPSGVIYKGLQKAKEESYDIVLIDTAGRLQNKVNLMNELSKINKVIEKQIPKAPHETFLVIDATTGQNGIVQAKTFKEITNITGIILTKLDSSAKGGIVLAIKEETNIPVRYVGFGEKQEDLQEFDIEKYIYGLFKDLFGANDGK